MVIRFVGHPFLVSWLMYKALNLTSGSSQEDTTFAYDQYDVSSFHISLSLICLLFIIIISNLHSIFKLIFYRFKLRYKFFFYFRYLNKLPKKEYRSFLSLQENYDIEINRRLAIFYIFITIKL